MVEVSPGSRPFSAWSGALIALGVGVLTLPWPVRMATEFLPILDAVKVTMLNIVAVALLAVAALELDWSGRGGRMRFPPFYRIWFGATLTWFGVGILYGIIRGNPWLLIIQEGIPLVLFSAGVVIGSIRGAWPYLEQSYLMLLLILAVPLYIVSVLHVGAFNPIELRRSIVYPASAVFIPSMFFLLTVGRSYATWAKVGAYIGFAAYIIGQGLVVKRAPLMRAALAYLLGLLVIPLWTGRERMQRVVLFSISATAIIVALAVTPLGRLSWQMVSHRFESLDAVPAFFLGTGGTTEVQGNVRGEMFRLTEVGIFLDNMSFLEKVVGIGVGGYVVDDRLDRWMVNLGEGSRTYGRNSLHIGILAPMIKLGFPFFIFFHLPIFVLLFRWGRFLREPLLGGCWAFLLIVVLFSFIEGFWLQPGVELTTLLVGASVGFLMAEEGVSTGGCESDAGWAKPELRAENRNDESIGCRTG